MLKLTAPVTLYAEAGEAPAQRTISGLAVPWDETAIESGGTAVRFARGSLPTNGPAPKLIESHDSSQIRGLVIARNDTEAGMEFTAKIAATRAGDDALELLKMGAIDSVSVGVNPTKWSFDADGVMVIEAGDWMELSLVAFPAFSAAQITKVAAQVPTVPKEDTPMADATPNVEAAKVETPTTPILFAEPRRALKLPSPGEYIAAMRRGGHDWAQLNDNITKIAAAQGDVVVSDAAGVMPVPIVAPVYDDINPLRPIVTALGARAMPDAGATFIRPYVKVHSAVGEQSTELANLTNADFEVDDLVVTKKTFGGRLYLSEQVIDWSSPSMLDQAILDMAGQYALATEKYVVDQMADAITNTQEVVITSFADADEVVTDIYLAAASIAGTGNYLPNAIVVSPGMWATLGALKDGDDRPLFPISGPMNSAGQLPQGVTGWNGNILGLNLVVSNQIGSQVIGNASSQGYTAKTANEYLWLLNTRGVEVYENYKGFIRLENPSQLGVNIAVRGYFACQVVDVNMIRVLGPNATFS
jgi:HK97 family phage prohead protease